MLEGAGLIDVGRADDPLIFADPPSLSFHYLNVNHGGALRAMLSTISDAGNGWGTWQVELQPQSATAGAMLDLPASITVPPGGYALVTAVARASASAAAGDDYGFIVLRKGSVTRRIPYEFTVERPGLESTPAVKLQAASDRRHPLGHEQRQRLPLAGRTVRAGAELLGPADGRRRCRAALRHRARPAGGEHGRLRHPPVAELADRSLLPRLPRRERRHRLHGHARERERLPLPLPSRRAGGRHPVPAPGPVLRRGRLGTQRSSPASRSPASTCSRPG